MEIAFLFLVPAVIPTPKHRETIRRQEAAHVFLQEYKCVLSHNMDVNVTTIIWYSIELADRQSAILLTITCFNFIKTDISRFCTLYKDEIGISRFCISLSLGLLERVNTSEKE